MGVRGAPVSVPVAWARVAPDWPVLVLVRVDSLLVLMSLVMRLVVLLLLLLLGRRRRQQLMLITNCSCYIRQCVLCVICER